MDRILETGQTLLDGRRFADVSVNEICIAAGVSLSSFYARFESKERLLAVLHDRHITQRRAQIHAVLTELLEPGPTLRSFLIQAATIYVAVQGLDQPMVQTLRQEQLADAGLADRLHDLNNTFLTAVTDAALSLVPGAEHDAELHRRMLFVTSVVALALSESIHTHQSLSPSLPVSDPQVIEEIIDLWMLYAFAGRPPDRVDQS
jgi:AcrR family transcriptional regulator